MSKNARNKEFDKTFWTFCIQGSMNWTLNTRAFFRLLPLPSFVVIMLLILDGNSVIGEHVNQFKFYRARAVSNSKFISEKTTFAQNVKIYHLIKAPWLLSCLQKYSRVTERVARWPAAMLTSTGCPRSLNPFYIFGVKSYSLDSWVKITFNYVTCLFFFSNKYTELNHGTYIISTMQLNCI